MNLSKYPRNVRLFVLFRMLFNARFYYPVFAVMFLDYGLSMGEFALLNVAWAAAIVGLEVPSGALADRFGRSLMVKLAAALMVLEMAIIAFVPVGNHALVLGAFLLNRILSGAAEALASGADEALAYDSLVEAGMQNEWPRILEAMMRWQALGFTVAMLVGAAVFDPIFIQSIGGMLGLDWQVDKSLTMRLPVILTLISAAVIFFACLSLKEAKLVTHQDTAEASGTIDLMRQAGGWILRTPAVLGLLVVGLLHDSFTRVYLTVGSEYYRLIKLPEFSFGIIGAVFAAMGFGLPILSRWLAENRPQGFNFSLVALLNALGLIGLGVALPYFGLMFPLLMRIGMGFMNFFMSHYLNQLVDSRQRATVLSFRGLIFNFGYGFMLLVYAGIYQIHGMSMPGNEDEIFRRSLATLPILFFAAGIVVWIIARRCRAQNGHGMKA
ncbi:MAG TPA: MFS transporter [Verrucomicrobiae bacterium]